MVACAVAPSSGPCWRCGGGSRLAPTGASTRCGGDGHGQRPAGADRPGCAVPSVAVILTTEAGDALLPPDLDEASDVVRFERLVANGQRLAAHGLLAAMHTFYAERTWGRAWWRPNPGPELTWAWGATVSSRANWEALCREHRCASACGSCSSWPCTGADGRPRLCVPTQKSVIAWPGTSRPGPAGAPGPHPGPGPCRSASASQVPPRPLQAAGDRGHSPPAVARDEVVCPEVAARSGAASAAERAAGPRDRVEVDARLRTRWLRQDDAAHRVARGGPAAPPVNGGVALARPDRHRSRILLVLCDRRAAGRGIGGRRECTYPPAGAPAAPDRNGAYRAAQRPGRHRG